MSTSDLSSGNIRIPRRSPQIAVVGVTGSGKTTLAKQLAAFYQIAFIEMDALNWEPNWTQAPQDVFERRIEETTRDRGWVVDGNYGRVRNVVFTRADTVVWLDYPLRVIMWRLLLRTFRRATRRETLWNGNKERFWTQFCTRDSILLWALRTYRRRRKEYLEVSNQSEYAHLKVVRLRSPKQTRDWLANLQDSGATAGSCGSVRGVR
jgi:adenylate kinase family enzyme